MIDRVKKQGTCDVHVQSPGVWPPLLPSPRPRGKSQRALLEGKESEPGELVSGAKANPGSRIYFATSSALGTMASSAFLMMAPQGTSWQDHLSFHLLDILAHSQDSLPMNGAVYSHSYGVQWPGALG